MKKLLILLAAAILSLPVHAQTTNTVPVVETLTIIHAVPNDEYRLFYNATTKKVQGLAYMHGISDTPVAYFRAATYAEVQAYCTANSLIGLDKFPQKAGQP